MSASPVPAGPSAGALENENDGAAGLLRSVDSYLT
jgi:hypothetical protein